MSTFTKQYDNTAVNMSNLDEILLSLEENIKNITKLALTSNMIIIKFEKLNVCEVLLNISKSVLFSQRNVVGVMLNSNVGIQKKYTNILIQVSHKYRTIGY